MQVSGWLASFHVTRHARERAWERHIPLEVMALVLRHGRLIRVDRYALAGVPRPATVSLERWRQALGVVVVVVSGQRIVTVFRLRRGQRSGSGTPGTRRVPECLR